MDEKIQICFKQIFDIKEMNSNKIIKDPLKIFSKKNLKKFSELNLQEINSLITKSFYKEMKLMSQIYLKQLLKKISNLLSF